MLIGRHDGLYIFNGLNAKRISLSNLDNTNSTIQTIFQQSESALWIGTDKNGIYLLDQNLQVVTHFNNHSHGINNRIDAIIKDENNIVWATTNQALLRIDTDFKLTIFPLKSQIAYFSNQKITSLIQLSTQTLTIGTSKGLYLFNKETQEFKALKPNILLKEKINTLKIFYSSLWIGTDSGLYQLNLNTHNISKFKPSLINNRVMSIDSHNNTLWLGVLGQGIFELESHNNFKTTQYTSLLSSTFIKDNAITSIYIDKLNNLWVGTFNKGIQVINLGTKEFYKAKAEYKDIKCFNNKTTYGFYLLDNGQVLIIQNNGILKFDTNSKSCNEFIINDSNTGNTNSNIPLTITQKGNGTFYIGTTKGVLIFDLSTGKFSPLPIKNFNLAVNFILPVSSNIILVGTFYGLYKIDTHSLTSKKMFLNTNFENAKFLDILNSNKQPIILTNQGIVKILDFTEIISLNSVNKHLTYDSEIDSYAINNQNQLIIATNKAELLLFDDNYELIERVLLTLDNKQIDIVSIIQDHHKNYWMGTNSGLVHYDSLDKKITHLTTNHGLSSSYFLPNALNLLKNGQLILGGKNGFDIFTPKLLDISKNTAPLVLTGLYRFNKIVVPNQSVDNFIIKKPINDLAELNLTYRDYIIGLEFNSLDYIQSHNYDYYYMLDGFDRDWNLSGNNNQASYTNLPPGKYEFKIYYTDSLKIIKSKTKSLLINVSPPPWLTWWALTSYFFLIVFIIYWYIQRKIKTNQRIAAMLRIEVEEKTKELQIQKGAVESLLAKKNDLFSHVSHEFRTPLTLILGPIKELLGKSSDTADKQSLNVINRSANRLLTLVEQLLQIARVSDFKTVETSSQYTQNQIHSVVSSFQHMAQRYNIDLKLHENQQAKIKATDQCIDTVLGNLISNAIKYTEPGGFVNVSAYTTSESFIISVDDSGPGLSKQQQKDIFKRFKRLESNKSTVGIGIGLSVVEEVVNLNNGEIKVESSVGVGSQFICSIPLSEETIVDQEHVISTLTKRLQVEHEENLTTETNKDSSSESGNLPDTVLVIEDNDDMRDYIVGILKPHYNYLIAKNGSAGVKTAIEQIPDIIISDIMMPEMDGFEVSRIIRSDQKTSHIPLMLLTSLNDKSSRIKGWRENVDAYMTKPFDRDELLVLLENMLAIRDILKKKAGQQINKQHKQTPFLPKKDQEFIDRLMLIIKENFQDPILNRTKIASKMAVSERQLQRKVKALIDQNPMEMLREYRLTQAKKLIKDGYQIGFVADECGFNSVSYFSQCFKAQFGTSPKQYQKKP
jgi:signal transduction histidine kinase/ligand-binding sensor domain-containing protein/AraC-like DNA-binding protein